MYKSCAALLVALAQGQMLAQAPVVDNWEYDPEQPDEPFDLASQEPFINLVWGARRGDSPRKEGC